MRVSTLYHESLLLSSMTKHVVKSLDADSTELAILKVLLDHPSPRNHTIPAELLPCEETTLALMPGLSLTSGLGVWPTFERILQFSHELIEVGYAL